MLTFCVRLGVIGFAANEHQIDAADAIVCNNTRSSFLSTKKLKELFIFVMQECYNFLWRSWQFISGKRTRNEKFDTENGLK